jgi:hypothetical protein
MPGESVGFVHHYEQETNLSVETPTTTPGAGRHRSPGNRTDAGGGWLTFAGILLLIDGAINAIGGIGAIGDSKFFVADTKYVIGNLHAWGWVILILGTVQLITAFGLFARAGWARAVGVVFAGLNSLALLLLLPAAPLWALALFTMEILIIFGLVSYGGEDA